jgi:hypothetical protein
MVSIPYALIVAATLHIKDSNGKAYNHTYDADQQ